MGLRTPKNPLKALLGPLVYNPSLWRCVEKIPPLRKMVPPWQRVHPFDRQYGTDTSGIVPNYLIPCEEELQSQITVYGGSQPSVVRRALAALGNVEQYSFVDIGCGKGRAMIIAGEFPFRDISGIEISSRLAAVARHNMAIVECRYPKRPKAAILEGNAVTSPFPGGNLALYLYHPFGAAVLSPFLKRLESLVQIDDVQLMVVYYNPVLGEMFDSSPAFTRWYAANLNCDESELDFGPDPMDTVIIWRSTNAATATPHAHANRPIVFTKPLCKVELAP
jgi:SAM-dependent methyltransferase